MHSLGSEIAPNRASDLGWFYYICRILQYVFKPPHARKSMLDNERVGGQTVAEAEHLEPLDQAMKRFQKLLKITLKSVAGHEEGENYYSV